MPKTKQPNEWDTCLRISELPEVDETIRTLLADPNEDNAVGMVCAIRKQVRMEIAADITRYLNRLTVMHSGQGAVKEHRMAARTLDAFFTHMMNHEAEKG